MVGIFCGKNVKDTFQILETKFQSNFWDCVLNVHPKKFRHLPALDILDEFYHIKQSAATITFCGCNYRREKILVAEAIRCTPIGGSRDSVRCVATVVAITVAVAVAVAVRFDWPCPCACPWS